jgi:hypothetical protein
VTHAKDVYKMPDGFDPDTNHHLGLPTVNIIMCMNQSCPDAKRCRRHKDSGAAPLPHYQTYKVFNCDNKKACPSYFPKEHKHVDEK